MLDSHVDQCLARLVSHVENTVRTTPSLGLAIKATQLAETAKRSKIPAGRKREERGCFSAAAAAPGILGNTAYGSSMDLDVVRHAEPPMQSHYRLSSWDDSIGLRAKNMPQSSPSLPIGADHTTNGPAVNTEAAVFDINRQVPQICRTTLVKPLWTNHSRQTTLVQPRLKPTRACA